MKANLVQMTLTMLFPVSACVGMTVQRVYWGNDRTIQLIWMSLGQLVPVLPFLRPILMGEFDPGCSAAQLGMNVGFFGIASLAFVTRQQAGRICRLGSLNGRRRRGKFTKDGLISELIFYMISLEDSP